jgi:putative NADH-flavin reductase
MKIAVYGATGMVGGQIVKESLRRGHDVTAVSRTGAPVRGATACSADLADVRMFANIAEITTPLCWRRCQAAPAATTANGLRP